MKSCCTLVALVLFAFCTSGQTEAQIDEVSPDAGIPDRMTLVKNSMQLDKWHEESFWAAYDNYKLKVEEVSPMYDARLNKLARMDETVGAVEAFDNAFRVITDRVDQIGLWQQHFAAITTSNNGAIGLKFLQTETLLAMMDEAGIYEAVVDHTYARPVTNLTVMNREQRKEAIGKALLIKEEKKAIFFETFDRYETERIDLLGDDYSVYDLYVGDPTDFTPAFSKRLGRDFLEVMKRETKLKEKYLTEMARATDPATAARFIALEDYQSILSKMYLWSTTDGELVADGSH